MSGAADSPGMECDALPPPRRHLPQLEYRRVGDMSTRTAFAHLVTTCFHIPSDISLHVYQDEAPWHTDLEVWLGYLDGFAVTSAAVIEAAGGLGIYSVATLPAWRRMGMAEATMRHAHPEPALARRQRAAGVAVLLQWPGSLQTSGLPQSHRVADLRHALSVASAAGFAPPLRSGFAEFVVNPVPAHSSAAPVGEIAQVRRPGGVVAFFGAFLAWQVFAQ